MTHRISNPAIPLALVVLAVASCRATPRLVGESETGRTEETPASAPSRFSNLAQALDERVGSLADSGFSGAVMVTIGDSTILLSGYGWTDSTRQYAITAATHFYVASIAKSFTAAAVLKLREQGLLALDDSIGRFFPVVGPDKGRITLRQLLTHTAGIGHNFAATGMTIRDSAVKAILAEPLHFVPGDDFILRRRLQFARCCRRGSLQGAV